MAQHGTILVGTDGSVGAAAAMTWAADFAHATGRTLHTLHCMPEHAESEAGDQSGPAEALTLWAAATSRPGLDAAESVMRGDPRVAIPEVAAQIGASVVVVGARGEGGFEGLRLGRVAQHVLHHVDVPVAVVPHRGGPLQNGVVVVGLDGSPANKRAIEWAADVAPSIDGRLHAVFVHDPMADSYPHGNVSNWKYRGQAQAEQILESVVGSAEPAVDATFINRGGSAVEVLAGYATESDAAMIVIGTRGHWGFGGRVLGHVASQLPAHSPCPVVVVPHGR